MRKNRTKKFIISQLVAGLLASTCIPCLGGAAPAPLEWPVDKYNVTWNSPSANSGGAMPVGNGDLGLIAWVEPGGELCMRLGKSDAFDEFNRLLKLGEIRIKTTPALVKPGGSFSQILRLADGTIEIKTPTASLRIWVDANHPVAQVDLTATEPVSVDISLDDWRKEAREIPPDERFSMCYNWPDKYRVNPDTILPSQSGQIGWCHRNIESQWKRNLELTGLASEIPKEEDPVLGQTFGALVRSEGCTAVSGTELQTAKPVTQCSVQIYSLTAKADSTDAWLAAASKGADAMRQLPVAERYEAHRAWWHSFWNRSWIDIEGEPDKADSAIVARTYNLQRYVLACAGRGALPVKFNGSIFTWDGAPLQDYRHWGGGFWWQNTRLCYWPMLATGDYEMMQPLFAMYRNALPLREAATKAYYHHGGAFYPESMYFWGNYLDENYGFDRKGKPDGLLDNGFIRRHWEGGIELVAMMLDYYDDTQDAGFRDRTLLPIARDIVTFYDQHWQRGADGKIDFEPAQALETWWNAKNPTPEVAGLRCIVPRLLQLPVDDSTKAQWRKLLADLPPIAMTQDAQGKWILPAEIFSSKNNGENPELYAVFPYGQFGCAASVEERQIGQNTFRHRRDHGNGGWTQDVIDAAMLGLTDDAEKMEIARARSGTARFPDFYGIFDWPPDQDHPSVEMIALQRMLMQCDGRRILLLPAWPPDWNASFKLHAPFNTTVEGKVENGKVTELKVTPETRHKDVELRSAADGQP